MNNKKKKLLETWYELESNKLKYVAGPISIMDVGSSSSYLGLLLLRMVCFEAKCSTLFVVCSVKISLVSEN